MSFSEKLKTFPKLKIKSFYDACNCTKMKNSAIYIPIFSLKLLFTHEMTYSCCFI